MLFVFQERENGFIVTRLNSSKRVEGSFAVGSKVTSKQAALSVMNTVVHTLSMSGVEFTAINYQETPMVEVVA